MGLADCQALFFIQPKPTVEQQIKKIQVIKFTAKQGNTVEYNANTKTEHDRIVGAFFRLSEPEALLGATVRMWIDDTEIIPDDTEVALLHHSDDMSIDEVAFPLNEKAKNSPIRVLYKDDARNMATDQDYEVRLYLLAVIDPKK
ncbi:hypothetical protein PEPS_47500 (plasmid) [Persicobacter psychrovividus]|uniref:Uncharacterized protein n=1 Tax=Persicobacter psychrovividus TaxID=387638 RepID=A0ABN6LH55_9BACT|nr:hypothetical protein PEPS_47500 [Persicobacter psychrovividus]